jgi:hypothetical protein
MTNAAAERGLQIHVFVFLAVVALTMVINVMTGPPWWVFWVIFPWCMGLGAHWYFTRQT